MQILEKTKFVHKGMWVCTAEAKQVLLDDTQKLLSKYGVEKAVFNVSVVVLGEFTDDPSVSIMCHAKAGSPIDAVLIAKLRSEFQEKYPDIDFNIY